MPKTKTRTAMFDISTYPQSLVEENARRLIPQPSWCMDGIGNITKKGWEVLNADCGRLERNAMAWMRQKFVSAVDHGHVDDALVGTVTFNPRSKTQRDLIEIGENERIDMTEASIGNFATTAMVGVSEFGRLVLGGEIHFKVDQEE